MRILFSAAISQEPFSPGIAWDRIHWLHGLRELGHEVYFVEELQPEWAVDSQGEPTPYAASMNRRRFVELMERFDFSDRACQLYAGGEATSGLELARLLKAAEGADLLLNMSGHLKDRRVLERVAVRVYLDVDPVYTQLWVAEYGEDLGFGDHDLFFTVGLEIGRADCPIPSAGVRWRHFLPPVVPELWPLSRTPGAGDFTTVASLTGFSELRHGGRRYGSKYPEFRKFAGLPSAADAPLEVSLKAFREEDPVIRAMRSGGWKIADAGRIAGLDEYRAYIARSRAEIGIAQEAYVAGSSGWFSDRSAQYLTAGRPVLAQATGFERHLPVGRGLLAFSTMDEAVAGIEEIDADYAGHCEAARRIAEERLSYRVVLPRFLEACAAGPPRGAAPRTEMAS